MNLNDANEPPQCLVAAEKEKSYDTEVPLLVLLLLRAAAAAEGAEVR